MKKRTALPPQLTPFIGRSEELAEISALLAEPACRLLTLVGAGGIGKTRLAIQAATALAADFDHGVYFVPLQAVQTVEFLVDAIAESLNLSLAGQADPKIQLFNHLRDNAILLVLDNFEQLLPGHGEAILSEILVAAPEVKLLVTSREVLNLQEEWLYQVQGMPVPGSTQTSLSIEEEQPPQAYDAVKLFVEQARRLRRDFSLAAEEADVVRICQLVEGMPLAIELAAAWTKTMQCAVIAAEIQRNIDFLATGLRNVPERQRSVRAVFEHSWQLLSQKERDVFKRLSVFRKGFRREAAERIAGASLAILTALVDKSLLRWEPDGRYELHDLLRQYATEQLVQSPDDVARVYDFHCAYYADFLQTRELDLIGGRQLEAIAEIEAELENIRAAWQWAVEQLNVEALKKSTESLHQFYHFRSRYLEGAQALDRAAERLAGAPETEQRDLALLKVLLYLSSINIRLGRLEEAEAALNRCQALYRRLDIPPLPGDTTDPLLGLGILALIRGDYRAAAEFGEQARQISETQNNIANRKTAYYVLTRAAFLQGNYETAQQYAQQVYAITEASKDRWFLAYCLNELGNVARALGDYGTAQKHYETSYRYRQEFNDLEGMALALNYQGEIALLQQAHAEAQELYQRSRRIYQEINDQGGLAKSLSGLGQTALALSDSESARHHFQQALQLATEIRFVPLILTLLNGIGELLLQTGRAAHGLELLSVVAAHPATDYVTREQARRLLNRHQADLPPELSAAATQSETARDLETIVSSLQAELAIPLEKETPDGQGPAEASHSPALVEQLTARELDVLRLMAEGLTNPEIAEELVLAVGTVKYYTAEIYGKLGVRNRVEAAARGRELGLL